MEYKSARYFKEAKLMLETIPCVATENSFALKGGTAINFFVRNMPRLSVDIDLTYLPIEDRATSLTNISTALERIAAKIRKLRPTVQVGPIYAPKTKQIIKLTVAEKDVSIKIEPNLVLRGTLFRTPKRSTVKAVEDKLELSATIKTVADADLYGGKLCAALDRQHPRDIFDVKLLLDNEGITDEIRKGFIVYLASHDRAMSALLSPNRKNIDRIYAEQFEGMPFDRVELQELLDVRERMITQLNQDLTEDERKFLLSLKERVPQWELLGVAGVETLPAIQWKLANIQKLKPLEHRQAVDRLKKILNL